MKANFLTRIRAKLKETINLSEFCEETRDIWDKKFYDIIDKLIQNIYNLLESTEFFLEQSDEFFKNQEASKILAFRTINLSLLMITSGCNFEIERESIYH